jgi:hypothetical protein
MEKILKLIYKPIYMEDKFLKGAITSEQIFFGVRGK